MRYVVSTTSGYSFVFRNVLEMEYDQARASLFVQMPKLKFTVQGVTKIVGGGDFEPWGNNMEILGPGNGGASAIAELRAMDGGHFIPKESVETFRRGEPVPLEIATTTFAPLEQIMTEAVGAIEQGGATVNVARAVSFQPQVPASIPLGMLN